MKVSSQTVTKIINGMTAKGLNRTDLARRIDMSPSWVSKLLNLRIDELKSDLIGKIEDALEVEIQPLIFVGGEVSPTAQALSEISEHDPQMAAMLESLLSLASKPEFPFIPVVETKRLPKVGAKITEIVHKWEGHEDPHYSKIAVEALDYLRNFFLKQS